MNYQEKKKAIATLVSYLDSGKSEEWSVQKLRDQGLKEYEIRPILQDAKREVFEKIKEKLFTANTDGQNNELITYDQELLASFSEIISQEKIKRAKRIINRGVENYDSFNTIRAKVDTSELNDETLNEYIKEAELKFAKQQEKEQKEKSSSKTSIILFSVLIFFKVIFLILNTIRYGGVPIFQLLILFLLIGALIYHISRTTK